MSRFRLESPTLPTQPTNSMGSMNFSLFDASDEDAPPLIRLPTADSCLNISTSNPCGFECGFGCGCPQDRCRNLSSNRALLPPRAALHSGFEEENEEDGDEIRCAAEESFDLSPTVVPRELNLEEGGIVSDGSSGSGIASDDSRGSTLSSVESLGTLCFQGASGVRPEGGDARLGLARCPSALPLHFPDLSHMDEDLPTHFDRLTIASTRKSSETTFDHYGDLCSRPKGNKRFCAAYSSQHASLSGSLSDSLPSCPQSCRSSSDMDHRYTVCAIPVAPPLTPYTPCTPCTPCGNDIYAPILPTVPPEDDRCQVFCIDPSVLVDVLAGKYQHNYISRVIFDCRFGYEYEVGHVKDALNIPTFDHLREFMSTEPLLSYEECPMLIILYCEFSKERSVRIANRIRHADRQFHRLNYPVLKYKEVYIVQGGYRRIHEQFQRVCDPTDYRPMDAEGFSHNKSLNWKRFVESVGRE